MHTLQFFNIISDKPCLIDGDFNIVISFNEKISGNWYSSVQCQIGQLWNSSSLIDLGFISEKNLLIVTFNLVKLGFLLGWIELVPPLTGFIYISWLKLFTLILVSLTTFPF